MTPETFKERMEYIDKHVREEYDEEESHIRADELLCQVLKELGYGEGVEIFDNIPKWYA